jgi:hypothetical protein
MTHRSSEELEEPHFDDRKWIDIGIVLGLHGYYCLSTKFPVMYYNNGETAHAIALCNRKQRPTYYRIISLALHGKRMSIHRLYNQAIRRMKEHPGIFIIPPEEREAIGWFIIYSKLDKKTGLTQLTKCAMTYQ